MIADLFRGELGENMAMAHAMPPNERMQRARPRELADRLNLYPHHPLAARLAKLLRPTGILPNAVPVFGMLLVWAAAWAYAGLTWPVSVAAGFASRGRSSPAYGHAPPGQAARLWPVAAS